MAPKRKTPRGAGDPSTSGDETQRKQRAAADAQMFVASTNRDEKDAGHRNRGWPEPQDAAPTVGKTGGRGSRAERPSPVSDRKEAARPPVEVTRTSKPPAETPRARAGRTGRTGRSGTGRPGSGSGPKAAAA